MNRLNAFSSLVLFALVIFSPGAWSQENLYVFVFKDGSPQSDIRVSVGDIQGFTSEFGLAAFALTAGEYEIGYYDKDKLFALTEINLVEAQQSQVFLTLTREGASVELDLPIEAYDQQFEQRDVKPQEGPKGVLELSVKDSKSKQPVTAARLFFKGYAIEAVTDDQGRASVELAQGEYDISVVHPKYIMRVVRDIKVVAETSQAQDVELVASDIVMDEFIVTAPAVEGSLASTLTDLKDSDVLADALSSEQFSKAGDSSASSALKRVTGITVVDGKFVYIRGLGERYSTVLMNDLHVPSPEPTKRVVPLDIFPTGVIQSMNIQKTHSSNLPATFAGGTVLITTKDIPQEDNYIQGSVGVSYSQHTGKSALVNPDNNRAMPGIIIDKSNNFQPLTGEVRLGDLVLAEGLTPAEKVQLNTAMMNYRGYGLSSKTLEPGVSLSLSAGQSFKTSNGIKYGFAGSLYAKTDAKRVDAKKDEYVYNASTDSNLHTESGSFAVVEQEEKTGGLISFGVDTLQGHKAKYTFLALEDLSDVTNFGTNDRLIEGNQRERTFLQYVEKEMIVHQFNGEHQVGSDQGGWLDDVIVGWGIETAEANRREPGTFEYEYKSANNTFVLDATKMYYLYSDLNDQVDNMRIDLTLPFKWFDRDSKTRFGFFDYEKTRSLDNRRFNIRYSEPLDTRDIDEILTEQNVFNGSVDVIDAYRPADFYTASQQVDAFYVNQLLSPMEKLELSFGLRQEASTQTLLIGENEEEFVLETDDLFPSITGTWRFDEENQLRMAYSKTVSRPDFREFSPNRYKHPLTGDIIFGFEELKSTTIDNFEIKYEWYPSFDELVSLALFSKAFENPIETVRNFGDVEIQTSYRNAKSADSLGLELGLRLNFERYWSDLKHYFISANYAWIDSSIQLGKNDPANANDRFIPFLTTEDRPMQGQSPYVYNLQLGYDNFFTRRSVVLLYNEFGERIASLGIEGNPDIYEQPFKKLDFVVKWGLNDTYDEQVKRIGYNLTFKAENLLDSDIVMTQGDKVSFSSSPGKSYSLSFSMKF
jgi:outer membrane receptor protein involved in Fe transport